MIGVVGSAHGPSPLPVGRRKLMRCVGEMNTAARSVFWASPSEDTPSVEVRGVSRAEIDWKHAGGVEGID